MRRRRSISNIAIIPIRAGSKRLENKNIREFFGKPIFVHTLEHAKDSGLFDEIMVSTESRKVRELCAEYGLETPFSRPRELAADQAQLVHVVAHVLEEYERQGRSFDNFCLLWATAPMRTGADIQKAYAMLQDDDTEAVVGITDYTLPVFCAMGINGKQRLKPLFPEYQKLPGGKHPRAVCDNASMCWVKTSAFHRHGTWLPPKLKGYWMPRWYSIDIDTIEDWNLAAYYYENYFLKEKKN